MTSTPHPPRDYWPTADWKKLPTAVGDATRHALTEIDQRIHLHFPNILSLLVIHQGDLIFEAYYRGNCAEDVHDVLSINKSVLSSLVGIALQENLIPELDCPLTDYFHQDMSANCDPHLATMTLRHLLTMTSGFYYPRGAGDAQPIWERVQRSTNWVQTILDLPVKQMPGSRFVYKNIDAYLVSVLLEQATNVTVAEFAMKHLFQPLGIAQAVWKTEAPDGRGMGRLRMTARDMAKFGYLYLNQGSWGEQVLIAPSWIQASTTAQVGTYGYLWWTDDDERYSASGAGGSLIYILPEEDSVVVLQARHLKKFRDPRTLIDTYLLPVLRKNRR